MPNPEGMEDFVPPTEVSAETAQVSPEDMNAIEKALLEAAKIN